MGLLTDPSAGQGKVVKMLLKYYAKLCFLLYVVGVIYFCLLASSQLNSPTYFSENALLPGLVISEFKNDYVAKSFYEELKDEMTKYEDSIPYPWFLAKFRQIGLDAYTQNFTLNYPLGKSQKFEGKNVYAILRAPRAASTEALVLSVPYRTPTSVHLPTTPSIAIMLAFAKFAIREKYWAKDIIFLITEHEQLGMQAWLEAYHEVNCGHKGVLMSGNMKGRAGAIQAAINLELHSTEIGQVDLKIEGLNGQLPNLDLFNLVARMCLKEGITLTFKNRLTDRTKKKISDFPGLTKEWYNNFQTMMSMVGTQATGVPNGNHGLYYRFAIQAITIEGFAPSSSKMVSGGFYTMGHILEGIFRSLNNLLERFHQSFFFYLLPTSDRYISIGLYIPAICLLVATLFIKSYAKWCQLHENYLIDNFNEMGEFCVKKKKVVIDKSKFEKLTLDDWKEKYEDACKKDVSHGDSIDLGHICLVFVFSHIFGVILKECPKYVTQIGHSYGYETETFLFATFCAIFVLMLFVPFLIRQTCYRSMVFLNILSLIELGTMLLCVSMYNISLAMFLAVIYIPFALIINPGTGRLINNFSKLCWMMVHPMVLLFATVLVSSYITFSSEAVEEIIKRSVDATQKALIFCIVDSMIYGNWLYSVATIILLSNWFCFWYITFYKPKNEVNSEKKDN